LATYSICATSEKAFIRSIDEFRARAGIELKLRSGEKMNNSTESYYARISSK